MDAQAAKLMQPKVCNALNDFLKQGCPELHNALVGMRNTMRTTAGSCIYSLMLKSIICLGERDEIMAANINMVNSRKLVCVVGLGHVAGIETILQEKFHFRKVHSPQGRVTNFWTNIGQTLEGLRHTMEGMLC